MRTVLYCVFLGLFLYAGGGIIVHASGHVAQEWTTNGTWREWDDARSHSIVQYSDESSSTSKRNSYYLLDNNTPLTTVISGKRLVYTKKKVKKKHLIQIPRKLAHPILFPINIKQRPLVSLLRSEASFMLQNLRPVILLI